MANVGLERIRDLYNAVEGTPKITIDDTDEEAIGVVQDFLIEHGYRSVPNPQNEKGDPKKVPVYGKFGTVTINALRGFFKLKPTEAIVLDTKQIRKLIDEPVELPRARLSRLVFNLKADTPEFYVPPIVPKGILKVISLVSIFEGAFPTLGRNKDGVGLSYGIIQWNQRDKRLAEIVGEFKSKQPELFKQSFGNAKADEMLAHIRDNDKGGVIVKTNPNDPENGKTIHPQGLFELFKPRRPPLLPPIDLPWDELFIKAGRIKEFQKIQVRLAVANFRRIKIAIDRYAAAKITSQRGIAFMVDLSNQHGENGAERIFRAVVTDPMNELQALEAMKTESIRRIVAQYGETFRKGATDRRTFFTETKHLKNTAFDENNY